MQQSPFDNIFNIIGGITEGNEKPMKHGFYNAFALFVLAICCAAVYVLFLILEPFFKSLLWALLVGSILHPFKYKLSKKIKSWLEDLGKTNSSVIFGLLTMPVKAINFASDTIGVQFKDHYKAIIAVLSSIYVIPWLYSSVPRSFSCLFWQFINFIGFSTTMLINLCSSYITLTLTLGYFISVYFMWTEDRATIFQKMSQILWLVITSFLANLTGSFKVYTFILLQMFCIIGFVLEVLDIHKKLIMADPEASLIAAFHKAITNTTSEDTKSQLSSEHKQESSKEIPDSISESTLKEDSVKINKDDLKSVDNELMTKTDDNICDQESLPDGPVTPETIVKRGSWTNNEPIKSSPRHAKMLYKTRTMSSLPLTNTKMRTAYENRLLANYKHMSLDENYMKANFDSDDDSAIYFKLLFYACFCMLVWKHIWLLPVIMFFLLIHIIKRLLDFFGIWLYLENQYNHFMSKVKLWWEKRESALLPVQIRGTGKILTLCNSSITDMAYSSVDTASSCFVIIGLILFVIIATVFICIQIYSEALVVIKLSGSLLNSTFVQHSQLHAYLPDGWEEKLDSLIDNAYTYGREGITTGVRSIMKDGDTEKVAKVEEQILEVWDRVYQSWIYSHFSTDMGPQVDNEAVRSSWDSFVSDFSGPGLLDYTYLKTWLQANVGTLSAIASSMASNVSLLAGSLGAFTSLLLGGGGAIINWFINLVVFFTTLFYLLASSGALYKPVEVITQVQPNFGPKLGIALSIAINQVFRASFKMALFYGLWTWFVHNLFGANVVYLPSVLAAVLGAAPFLGPYLAGIPAALDVWLQGRPIAAILLTVAQASPIAFLDAAVYAEIKDGGHPYVTGLAIAGGIFYLGPEGAILGPLLLCCLMVVLNLSSTFLRDTPSEERAALHTRVRLGAYL